VEEEICMLKFVHDLDTRPWESFVGGHSQGNVFHTPEMFQVFAQARGHRPSLWAVTDENNTPVALFMPVQITLFNRWLRKLTSRAVAFGSILAEPGPRGEEALALLMSVYKKAIGKSILFTELRNVSNLERFQPLFRNQSFLYEGHLNYLVEIKRPPEEVFQKIGPRTRKNIKRVLKKGDVAIREVRDRDGVDACYELLKKTYKLAHVPLADSSLFNAAFDILMPKKMIKFTLACVSDEPAAASVELLYKDVMYGWFGGIDRSFSSYGPNELLMWYILEWGAENGYRVYDFGGAGKPGEDYGVRDFKAKFGGELVSFGRNICVHNPMLLRLSELGYRFYRRLL
jgi:serine/alanine adding enzyme